MVFKDFCVLVLWTKVASALEGLNVIHSFCEILRNVHVAPIFCAWAIRSNFGVPIIVVEVVQGHLPIFIFDLANLAIQTYF